METAKKVMSIDREKEPPPAEPMKLIAKLAKVMALIGTVAKRGRNTSQNYSYATEADIVEAVREHLSTAGIVLIPSVEKLEWREIQGRNGAIAIATAHMSFTFTDGEDSVTYRMVGEGMDSGDKNTYKAMTGAEKYALMKFFLIPTGDDPEKDDKTESGAGKAPEKPVQAPAAATIGQEAANKFWAAARTLWPKKDEHEARIKAHLAKWGVAETNKLPGVLDNHLNELNELKRLEKEGGNA